MGLRITLRTDRNISYFQRHLLQLIQSPNKGNLLLCSGYVCECPPKKYSILDDKLLDAIVNGCNHVDFVYGMPGQSGCCIPFIKKMQKRISVTAYKALRWHAKIAIKLHEDNPIAGLIGSSNLTQSAYRETYSLFNYEADVLIWIDSPDYNKYFQRDASSDDPFSPIKAVLSERQPNEELRLNALYKLIMETVEPIEV